jgi:hypothetical protein
MFLSAGSGKTTTVSIGDPNRAQEAGLEITNTPGNVAVVDLSWRPDHTAEGLYLLLFTATDDYDPPGVTEASLTILVDGRSFDCNGNGLPDECDIASGASQDVNENGMPDECEPQACCLAEGECRDLTADDCLAQQGEPQGLGTACASEPCQVTPPPTQACCFPDMTCLDLEPAACDAMDGFSQGPETDCESTGCEI